MPPHRPHRRVFAVVTALSLLAIPRAVRAEPDSPEDLPGVADEPSGDKSDPQLQRAMRAYEAGQASYNMAKYEEALGHFQEAASLYGSPDFQYNIGLCYEKLDKFEEAVRAFETYLRAKPDANDRAQVEDRIVRLKERMEEEKNKPDPDEGKGDDTTADTPPPTQKDGRGLVIGGAVLIGVGAALGLGGGIGFGVVARARSNELDEVQTGGNPGDLTFTEAEDLEARGTRAEVLQITFAAIGAAVAITGVALLAVGLTRKKKAAKSARARLVPQWTRGGAGVALTGRF